MHSIERELIEATGYKAQRKFSNRQDYLGSILNAVIKLTDDDFDNLSDEAAVWANAAIEAKNSKSEELPDFDEAEDPTDEDDETKASDDTEETEDEEDGADDEADEADEAEPESDEDSDHDPETGEVIEPEPEPVKKPKKAGKAKPEKIAIPKPEPKAGNPKGKKFPGSEDAVLDKWGAIEGSLNSKALVMFEKGSTMKEVKEALGGSTFYNILKRAVQAGHRIEKEGALITLFHKDSGKKGAPTAKKGKK